MNRRPMLLKRAVIKTTLRWSPPARRTMARVSSFRNPMGQIATVLCRRLSRFSCKTRPVSEGKTLICSSKHFWLPSLLARPLKGEIEDKTVEFANPRPQQVRPMLRSPWRRPGRIQTEPRQPSSLQVESSSVVQVTPRERCSRLRLWGAERDS